MQIWRMSFRCGNQGHEMLEDCIRLGVAAITYRALAEVNLVEHEPGEPREKWAKLQPAQKSSLSHVAYDMKKGDVIYAKQGPKIVCRARVLGSYKFDAKFRLACPDSHVPWSHQVPVKWETDFEPVDILLGAEPLTVLRLDGQRLKRLEKAINKRHLGSHKQDAIEGQELRREVTFRKRSLALIEAKKANSDGRCEACEFSFKEVYGTIDKDFLIGHHRDPMANRSGPSKTTIDDIALICPNCHAVIHAQGDKLLSIKDLRKRLGLR